MGKKIRKRSGLRLTRIAVSVAIFVMVTLVWLEYSDLFLRPLGWVSRIQIFPVAMGLSVAMLAFWLGVSLLFGRVYCSSVCPLGTWLDIVGHAGRRSRQGEARDYRYSPALTRLRYVSLAVFAVGVAASLAIVPMVMEPYSIYSRFVVTLLKPAWGELNNLISEVGVSTGWWDIYYVGHVRASLFAILLSVFTMVGVSIPAWFFGRTYCNTICPVGTILGVASARAVWRIDIDTDLCTNCRRCEYACKASCINLDDHVVDGSRCVNCFDCIDACGDDAIFYRPTRKQLSLPMMQRLQTPRVSSTSSPASVNYESKNDINNETIS